MRPFNLLLLVLGGVLVAACHDGVTGEEGIGTPTILSVTTDGSRATVTWSEVPGADGYRVDLKNEVEAPRVLLVPTGVTTALFDDLTPGSRYEVAVSARRNGQSGRWDTQQFVPATGDDPPETARDSLIARITAELPHSLHGTAGGMKLWYEAPTGFGARSGVPYSALTCGGCHSFNSTLTGVPSTQPCLACHTELAGQPGKVNYDSVDAAKCLECHSRQAAELAMNLPDVHRAAGMTCSSCHTAAEVHGTGAQPAMFYALATRCEDCHVDRRVDTAPGVPYSPAHLTHSGNVSCDACHMSGSVTCVNCHLEDDVTKQQRVAYKRFADWIFLGNWRDQVRPLNVQTVEYQGKTFAAWGPFHGHTIVAAGRICTDCHGGANIGPTTLRVTRWNDETKSMDHLTGVIPVPADYAARLIFDFVVKNPDGTWTYLKTGADHSQMLFATPLTARQLGRLSHLR